MFSNYKVRDVCKSHGLARTPATTQNPRQRGLGRTGLKAETSTSGTTRFGFAIGAGTDVEIKGKAEGKGKCKLTISSGLVRF